MNPAIIINRMFSLNRGLSEKTYLEENLSLDVQGKMRIFKREKHQDMADMHTKPIQYTLKPHTIPLHGVVARFKLPKTKIMQEILDKAS